VQASNVAWAPMSADERPATTEETEAQAQEATAPQESRVIASIRKWLNEQGYPLEMRVARAFQRAGAFVQQSVFYTSDEDVQREIDVCAQFGKSFVTSLPVSKSSGERSPIARIVRFDLVAVVECKSSPTSGKPWVIFTSGSEQSPKTMPGRLANPMGENAIPYLETLAYGLPLFKVSDSVGYSVVRAFNKADDQESQGKQHGQGKQKSQRSQKSQDRHDEAYAAITALASASHSVAELEDPLPTFQSTCRIVFPMLVVDTPIVECWLDEEDMIQLCERDQMTLVWRRPHGDRDYTIIEILHERALARYIDVLASGFEALSGHVATISNDLAVLMTRDKGRPEP
jgi:hypothetical protein